MPWRGGQKLEKQTSIKDPQIGHAGSMNESCMALYRLTTSLSTYGYVWKWRDSDPDYTPNIKWGNVLNMGFLPYTSVYPENQWGCSSRIYGIYGNIIFLSLNFQTHPHSFLTCQCSNRVKCPSFQNWIGGNIIELSPALDWAKILVVPPNRYTSDEGIELSGRTSFKNMVVS